MIAASDTATNHPTGPVGDGGDQAVADLFGPVRTTGGSVGTSGGRVRVGIDVTGVAEVADSVRVFGDRYLQRIYTPHELDCCRSATSESGLSYESLAARFAAKEAAIKVLRPVGPRPEWRAIEVKRQDDGSCVLTLAGLAAGLAEQAGLDHLAVSLTHDAGIGAAVVVAMGHDPGEADSGATEAVRSNGWTACCTIPTDCDYPFETKD
jgi:holo-[acyl-carrier protein] synthase